MVEQRQRPRLHERLKAARLSKEACPRTCAWPGCMEAGDYRAPRSREALRDYIWLCLEHVREYNRGWDYFAGMDAEDIDRHRRQDTTWHRPSWRFGTNGFGPAEGIKMGPNGPWRWRDPFDILGDDPAYEPPPPPRPGGKAAEMLAVMGLSWGFTVDDLKRRYKDLVKRHHPDLHGGDRALEERLKRINEAYGFLKSHARDEI